MRPARVYLSVSASFTDEAEVLRQMVLIPCLGLHPEEVFLFRTSRGSNIPISADSRRTMAERAGEADAFLFLVDSMFLGSAFCFMELGAAWVRSASRTAVARREPLRPELQDALHGRQVVLVHGGVRKRQIGPPEFPPLQAGELGSVEDVIHATEVLGYLLDRPVADDLALRAAEFIRELGESPSAGEPPVPLERENPLDGIVTPSVRYASDEVAELVFSNFGDTQVSNVQVQFLGLEGCDLGGGGMPSIPTTFRPHQTHAVPLYRNARSGSVHVRILGTEDGGAEYDFPHELDVEFP